MWTCSQCCPSLLFQQRTIRKWAVRNILPGNPALNSPVWMQTGKPGPFGSHRDALNTNDGRPLGFCRVLKVAAGRRASVPETGGAAAGFSCWHSSGCPPSQRPDQKYTTFASGQKRTLLRKDGDSQLNDCVKGNTWVVRGRQAGLAARRQKQWRYLIHTLPGCSSSLWPRTLYSMLTRRSRFSWHTETETCISATRHNSNPGPGTLTRDPNAALVCLYVS